jgi:hypothetical protein
MGSNRKTFKTVVLEDGTCAVVRTDPSEPSMLHVVAVFYDAARARKYADIENSEFFEAPRIEPPTMPQVKRTATSANDSKEPNGMRPELTERQSAVLEALRAKADDDNLVEIKGADLAEAASIPLGSVHSVIQSLEKKKCILTARPGSSHAPAVYQVLSPTFASVDALPSSLQ